MVDFAHSYNGQELMIPVYADDEGTEAVDAMLIKNGVLKNFMSSRETAAKLGIKATGNARAYTFSDEPLVRMRNTAILPGKSKLADMIRTVDAVSDDMHWECTGYCGKKQPMVVSMGGPAIRAMAHLGGE